MFVPERFCSLDNGPLTLQSSINHPCGCFCSNGVLKEICYAHLGEPELIDPKDIDLRREYITKEGKGTFLG